MLEMIRRDNTRNGSPSKYCRDEWSYKMIIEIIFLLILDCICFDVIYFDCQIFSAKNIVEKTICFLVSNCIIVNVVFGL